MLLRKLLFLVLFSKTTNPLTDHFLNSFVKENWVKNVEACPQDG